MEIDEQIEKATLQLKSELDQVRLEMVAKDELLEEQAEINRVIENETVEEEQESDIVWFLFAAMTMMTLMMVMVVACLCIYIRNQKK